MVWVEQGCLPVWVPRYVVGTFLLMWATLELVPALSGCGALPEPLSPDLEAVGSLSPATQSKNFRPRMCFSPSQPGTYLNFFATFQPQKTTIKTLFRPALIRWLPLDRLFSALTVAIFCRPPGAVLRTSSCVNAAVPKTKVSEID